MCQLVSDGEGGGEAVILDQSTAVVSADGAQLCQSQGLTALALPLAAGLRADVVSRHQQRHVVQQRPRLVLVHSGLPGTETGQHLCGGHLVLRASAGTKTLASEAHDLHCLHLDVVTDTRVSEHLVNLATSDSVSVFIKCNIYNVHQVQDIFLHTSTMVFSHGAVHHHQPLYRVLIRLGGPPNTVLN